MDDGPIVTLIVVPRERFSYTQGSLESIYENSDIPFRLIYVDGGSPRSIRQYLRTQAEEKGFQLMRTDHYLSPNRARNLGLQQVKTKYAVFIDNDVVVAPGWLSPLVQCAEETKAAVVGPLLCQGLPLHTTVHASGGSCEISVEVENGKSVRRLHDKMLSQHQEVSELRSSAARRQTQLAEFHCMLVRTDLFKEIGPLDEKMLSTREHIDLCLSVAQAGKAVYLEPASIVTYLYREPLESYDLPFYLFRWNDLWITESLDHFCRKWGLEEGVYIKKHRQFAAVRRKKALLDSFLHPLTGGRPDHWLERTLVSMETACSRYFAKRYIRGSIGLKKV